ncbi:WbqC family protein [Algoriphagus mannitolivorans]|uniref:WbqC family protein n=1 Tax=Algoriphagus mannitolivorans TaxID=226504 RepID=UPI0003F77B1B|nr:WbqC family protein [Algoriphagus mannitolivorans]
MKRVAIDLHYLPTLEFFAAIHDADEVLIFPNDLYQRQSFLNRTKILLANKVETLSIPIQGRRPKIPLSQVKIDYSQKWQSIHLRGIQSAYGKAPFFEYFFPYVEGAILKGNESLWDLNKELLTICLKLLRWPVKIGVLENLPQEEEIIDIRGHIVPGRPFLERDYFFPSPYPQVFGLDFEPNLSILDLLFCLGPEAGKYLKDSAKKE